MVFLSFCLLVCLNPLLQASLESDGPATRARSVHLSHVASAHDPVLSPVNESKAVPQVSFWRCLFSSPFCLRHGHEMQAAASVMQSLAIEEAFPVTPFLHTASELGVHPLPMPLPLLLHVYVPVALWQLMPIEVTDAAATPQRAQVDVSSRVSFVNGFCRHGVGFVS